MFFRKNVGHSIVDWKFQCILLGALAAQHISEQQFQPEKPRCLGSIRVSPILFNYIDNFIKYFFFRTAQFLLETWVEMHLNQKGLLWERLLSSLSPAGKTDFKSISVLKHGLETKYLMAACTGTEGSPWEVMHFFTSEAISLERIFIAKTWKLIICSVSLWCLCPCLLAVPHSLPQKCIFSPHHFEDYFTAPFENRWEICIIWIHKTHNLHLLQLG